MRLVCSDVLGRFWFLSGWSKSTCFLVRANKSLGFSVSIEVDLLFVWVVELYLVFAFEPKLAWFSASIECDCFLCVSSKFTCLQRGGLTMT